MKELFETPALAEINLPARSPRQKAEMLNRRWMLDPLAFAKEAIGLERVTAQQAEFFAALGKLVTDKRRLMY